MIKALTYINHFILYYFICSMVIYTALLFGSFFPIINYFKRAKYSKASILLSSKVLPPVTIIMPTFNEEENILNALESVLNSTYRNLYIILVNDASTDSTLKIISDRYQLFEVPVIIDKKLPTSEVKTVYVSRSNPNLMIIDKMKNAGSGDSINIGLNACFTPYFATFDADSIIDPNAITEFVYDIMTYPQTIAVGGGVYILNACKYKEGVITDPRLPYKLVPSLQALEYFRSHVFSRTGWNLFGGTMAYSGTATLLDRQAVLTVGGYDTENFAYDVEIIMRLTAHMRENKIPHKIRFNPAIVIWTDVPINLKQFAIQRDKWRRGMLRSSLRYWYMLFNPKYGIQGLIGYPGYLFLEILAPIIEFIAYFSVGLAYYYGILNGRVTILYILLAWGFVSYLTIANMAINLITFNRYKRLSDIFRIFILAVIETFGFRQFNVAVSTYGTVHYFFNRLRGKPV